MEIIKILRKIIIFKMIVLIYLSVKISENFNCFFKSSITSVDFSTFNFPNFLTFPSVLHSRSTKVFPHISKSTFLFSLQFFAKCSFDQQ